LTWSPKLYKLSTRQGDPFVSIATWHMSQKALMLTSSFIPQAWVSLAKWLVDLFYWYFVHKTLILDVPQNTCVISNRLYKSVTLHRLTDIMTKWLLCVIDTKVLISSGHLFLFLPAAELKEILCGYSNLYHLSRLLKSAHECRQWNPLHLVGDISVQYFQLSVFVCLDLANE